MEGIFISRDLFNENKFTVFFFEEMIGSVEELPSGECLAEPCNQKTVSLNSKEVATQYLLDMRNKQFRKPKITAVSLQPTLF